MGLEDWLERSRAFAKAAVELKRAGIYNLVCFNAHQAVEMALKGIIAALTGSHPFTHSLTELLEAIRGLGREVPEEVVQEAERLEPHYVLARYPSRGVKPYDENAANRCLSAMNLILSLVEKWRGESSQRG